MTASNVSHYEAGKQAIPPNVAQMLIKEGARRGVRITFDDIYGGGGGETVPEPQQEAA